MWRLPARLRLNIKRLKPSADSLVARHSKNSPQMARFSESRVAPVMANNKNRPTQQISAVKSQKTKLGNSIHKLSILSNKIIRAGIWVLSMVIMC